MALIYLILQFLSSQAEHSDSAMEHCSKGTVYLYRVVNTVKLGPWKQPRHMIWFGPKRTQ